MAQFGDQYLGDRTSDPTEDNSGNPLTKGDIYFNTASGVLKFYSGTRWVSPESVASAAASTAETKAAEAVTSAQQSLDRMNAAEAARATAVSAKNTAVTKAGEASNSESAASTAATTATQKATIATNKASLATSKASQAVSAADSATASESAASTSETNAANSAANASSNTQAAITVHTGESDPHSQYLAKSSATTLLADKADKTDARLTNNREWIGSTVSQSEAEAGTGTTRRAWTAQRVKQAIDTLLAPVIATVNTKLGKSEKAVDSDKLDGLNSTQFVRSDVDDTMEGNLTLPSVRTLDTKYENAARNEGVTVEYNESSKSLDYNFF
jgi:hypothetical protein